MTTTKTAVAEKTLQQYYGGQMLQNLGTGLGAGVGATALFQLLRELKARGKAERKYDMPPAFGSGAPIVANDLDEQGALPVKRGFDVKQLLGSMLPKGPLPGTGVGSAAAGPSADPHAWRRAWGSAANIGAAGLGAYGGHRIVNAIVKAKKKRELNESIDEARRSYYDALAGHDKAAALDAAYDNVKAGGVLGTISAMPQAARTAYVLSLLGAGGVGAHYMYNRTKDLNESENLAKARASRARLKGLPPVWVDPDSLAQVKQLATQGA